jgi:hypothetical protein
MKKLQSRLKTLLCLGGLSSSRGLDLGERNPDANNNLRTSEFLDTTDVWKLNTRHGVLRSTAKWSAEDRFDVNQWFQYNEKAQCALSVASIWPGRDRDYLEFGSTDLNTFRNFLTAFDVFDLNNRSPGTRFYGFDVFGDTRTASDSVSKKLQKDIGYKNYMELFSHRGDVYEQNIQLLREHDLFVDRCELIQGYFEDTLTDERASNYIQEGRQPGFIVLDCNIAAPYKVVFEYLFKIVRNECFIYLDEYYHPPVISYFEHFVKELNKRYGINARFIRNAGAFGALFYIFLESKSDLPEFA